MFFCKAPTIYSASEATQQAQTGYGQAHYNSLSYSRTQPIKVRDPPMLPGSILQSLVDAHQHPQPPLNLGVYYKNTLVALCHALEDFILESESQPLVIAAFQEGKWYQQEAERYGEMAQKAGNIVILAANSAGFADLAAEQAQNVRLVALKSGDPVGREWHLMIISPTYTAMVLCQEIADADYGSQGPPQEDKARKFYGFWTFEPELVQEAVELAIAHVGQYDRVLEQQLAEQVAAMTAEFGRCQRDDLGAVVAKVVSYLQTMQHEQDAEHLSEADLDANLLSNEMQAFLRMAQLIDRADAVNPRAAAEVAALAEALGQLLDLPAWQVKRLRLAGLLHRLAPLQGVSSSNAMRSPAQQEILQKQGLFPKASVLRVMPQLQAISHIIGHQTECWDGSGQPEGLAYDAIPLESRIIGLLEDFQQSFTVHRQQGSDNPLTAALSECQQLAGKAYDPKLVDALALLTMGIEQGMSLDDNLPKIASGMWLLDET